MATLSCCEKVYNQLGPDRYDGTVYIARELGLATMGLLGVSSVQADANST